jgi:hypothetical protein
MWGLPCARTTLGGKHRTEVMEGDREYGGWEGMGLGGRCGFRAGTLRRGKHRTEVTEATEGIKRLGGEWVLNSES